MYKCEDCGRFFDEPRVSKDYVPYGEQNVPIEIAVCPYCKGGFEIVYPCKDCGEYFAKDELHSFYCIDCLKEIWDKPDDLFNFGEAMTEKGQVNQFALEMFGGIEGVNDTLCLLLKSIFNCNPQMLKDKKTKFIEEYADELSEAYERNINGEP